jgi:hypothetical protein
VMNANSSRSSREAKADATDDAALAGRVRPSKTTITRARQLDLKLVELFFEPH